MAEANNTLEIVAAPTDADGDTTMAEPSSTSTPPPPPLTINDLPKEVLVSICVTINNPIWEKHTIPLVCKEWNEIYLSKDASPLHETLEVCFNEEIEREAARQGLPPRLGPATATEAQEPGPRRPVVHVSQVFSWAERRAGSVRKLQLKVAFGESLEDFSAEDLGALVRVVGSSLTEFVFLSGRSEFSEKPFWESLRDSVVPAGRLRSFVFTCIDSAASASDVEPLGQLAGSLEEVVLQTMLFRDRGAVGGQTKGLQRFPESLCALGELRRLAVTGHEKITALPAAISSLKKLKELELYGCSLSSLPKELGELSGLSKLCLHGNKSLGAAFQDVAFPPELRKMKSLQELCLADCGLGAVPAFVGELNSLEFLDLSFNDDLQLETLDLLIEGCPSLQLVKLGRSPTADPWTEESLDHIEAFIKKLIKKNKDARVFEE